MPVLTLASLRYLRQHPWQFGLSVLGVALGVAVVLAIDLTNASALKSFARSIETVSGRATHQIRSAAGEIPESVYVRLRRELGFRQAAPAVEGHVSLAEHPGQALQLLGVDPFAEAPFRPYLRQLTLDGTDSLNQLLTASDTAILAATTARNLGVGIGDVLTVRIGTQTHPLRIVGLLAPSEGFREQALRNLLLTDIGTAQRLLGLAGKLSRVDLRLPENPEWEARLRDFLPDGLRLEPVAAQVHTGAKLTRAFRINLTALSLLALLVGTFLIYNMLSFAVVQRYPLIGRLRALGVTRREVMRMVVWEALGIGLLGTALGLVCGGLLAQHLLAFVTQTINDFYFTLALQDLHLDTWTLAKGIGLGLGATLLAVLAPALEASGIPPLTVLRRSSTETSHRRLLRWSGGLGVLLLPCGVALLQLPTESLLVSYAGLFALLIGFALLTPGVTGLLLRMLRPLASRLFGTLGTMAVRGVQAELSRTSVAIAALMVAVSAAIALGIMVGSFRGTVVQWLESQLWADVYVSPPSLVSNRHTSFMDQETVDLLATAPGVRYATRYRHFRAETPEGPLAILALNLPPAGLASARFKDDGGTDPWQDFGTKPVVVASESLAYRRNLQTGAALEIQTPQGFQRFRVSGVFHDYASEQGFVLMSRTVFQQFWNDDRVNTMALQLAPGVDVEQAIRQLQQRLREAGRSSGLDHSARSDVILRSNRALREKSLEIFDRTFAITKVLQVVVAGVAFIGVLSALMALQLERQRELGVLRATGMTPGQLWRLVTSQCGLMGLVAGVLAVPVGILLAVGLIHVVNQRSFGWTFPTIIEPAALLEGIALAVLAAVLAGLYPAWRMARTAPALALREE